MEAILFRTHSFDQDLLAFYERLRKESGRDVYLVCDETEKVVNVPASVTKISLNSRLIKKLGLFQPKRVGWSCGDYFYYAARKSLPQYERFWMLEPDVRLNFNRISDFFDHFNGRADVDFIVAYYMKAGSSWAWTPRMEPFFPGKVFSCFFPVTRVSARAIDSLLDGRKTMTRDWSRFVDAPLDMDNWPNDESFCATWLTAQGFSCTGLNGFGKSFALHKLFRSESPVSGRLLGVAGNDDLLYHPVRFGDQYLEKIRSTARWCLAYQPPAKFINENFSLETMAGLAVECGLAEVMAIKHQFLSHGQPDLVPAIFKGDNETRLCRTLLQHARALWQQGGAEAAATLLRQLVQAYPDVQPVRVGAVELLQAMGRHDEAQTLGAMGGPENARPPGAENPGTTEAMPDAPATVKLMKTFHGTFVAYDAGKERLTHASIQDAAAHGLHLCVAAGEAGSDDVLLKPLGLPDTVLHVDEHGKARHLATEANATLLTMEEYRAGSTSHFSAKNAGGHYMAAEPGGKILVNRSTKREWERFELFLAAVESGARDSAVESSASAMKINLLQPFRRKAAQPATGNTAPARKAPAVSAGPRPEYEGPVHFFKATPEFLDLLKERNIFQARSGINPAPSAVPPKNYINRLKPGDVVSFIKGCVIESHSSICQGGRFFSTGSFSSVVSSLPENAMVGRYCSIAPGVRIADFRHPLDAVCMSSAFFNSNREFVQSYIEEARERDGQDFEFNHVPTPQPQQAPLFIGHDVWIGGDVMLTGGITIGNGAVIAARSVVTKSVPPYAVVGGTPAKVLKYRFPEEIRAALEQSAWWDYELSDLHALPMADPEAFCEAFERHRPHLRPYAPQTLDLWAEARELLKKP